jgi:hypothetical protein
MSGEAKRARMCKIPTLLCNCRDHMDWSFLLRLEGAVARIGISGLRRIYLLTVFGIAPDRLAGGLHE